MKNKSRKRGVKNRLIFKKSQLREMSFLRSKLVQAFATNEERISYLEQVIELLETEIESDKLKGMRICMDKKETEE